MVHVRADEVIHCTAQKKKKKKKLATENKTKKDTNQCVYILFTYVTFCIKCPSHTFWSNSESLSQHLQ